MKKITTFTFLLIISLVLFACKEDVIIPPEISYVQAMDTTFAISIYQNKDDVEELKKINLVLKEIEITLKHIHVLTDNFNLYDNDKVPIKNIAYINKHPNELIKIDEELYNIILLAEQYKIEFEGYFDISIGLIVDEWKKLINLDKSIFKYDSNNEAIPLTEAEFNKFLNNVEAIPIINDGIQLTNENNNHYILIKDGVKIDLGAIAKGYVVGKIKDMIKATGIINYKVEGSESSLEFGENPNRDGKIFRVGIRSTKPLEYTEIVEVKNLAIATSGDTVQNYIHNGIKYHHIVSPKTKRPESYRSLVTVIGQDSAKLDALTTALMSMPETKFNDFAEKYTNLTMYNIK